MLHKTVHVQHYKVSLTIMCKLSTIVNQFMELSINRLIYPPNYIEEKKFIVLSHRPKYKNCIHPSKLGGYVNVGFTTLQSRIDQSPIIPPTPTHTDPGRWLGGCGHMALGFCSAPTPHIVTLVSYDDSYSYVYSIQEN